MSRFETDGLLDALYAVKHRRRRDRLAVATVVATMADSLPQARARLEEIAGALPRPGSFDRRSRDGQRKAELAGDALALVEQLRDDLAQVQKAAA